MTLIARPSDPAEDAGSRPETGNRLLDLLRPIAHVYIDTHRIIKPLVPGDVLYEPNQPFTHAVFPHEGVVSLMAEMSDGRSVEKTSIGNEGFVGFALLLGGGMSLSRSVVSVGGSASWIALPHLDHALAEFPCLHDVMMRYGMSLVAQLMESVACNSLHLADQRIARWLLHAHDRVAGGAFTLTQESLSKVLGLRRATVSASCTALQRDGIISYSRGRIAIEDRAGLESRACECHARIARAYDWQRAGRWTKEMQPRRALPIDRQTPNP